MTHRIASLSLIVVLIVGGGLISSTAAAGWFFGPSTAKECRSEYASKVETHFAFRVLAQACDYLFDDNDNEELGECIIDHIGGAGSDIAIKLIVQSCGNIANDKESKRDKCLLSKLPGTDVDMAARQIALSCSE